MFSDSAVEASCEKSFSAFSEINQGFFMVSLRQRGSSFLLIRFGVNKFGLVFYTGCQWMQDYLDGGNWTFAKELLVLWCLGKF